MLRVDKREGTIWRSGPPLPPACDQRKRSAQSVSRTPTNMRTAPPNNSFREHLAHILLDHSGNQPTEPACLSKRNQDAALFLDPRSIAKVDP